MRYALSSFSCCMVLLLMGCRDHRSTANPDDSGAAQAKNQPALHVQNAGSEPALATEALSIAPGSPVKIRVDSFSGSDSAPSSGRFTATVLEPIVSGSETIPAGATATGEVVGQDQVATLELENIQTNGHNYALTLADQDSDPQGEGTAKGMRPFGVPLKASVPSLRKGVAVEFNGSTPKY